MPEVEVKMKTLGCGTRLFKIWTSGCTCFPMLRGFWKW